MLPVLPTRCVRDEIAWLRQGDGMCLDPRCYWRPTRWAGVEIDKQCQSHTGDTAHPTTFVAVKL